MKETVQDLQVSIKALQVGSKPMSKAVFEQLDELEHESVEKPPGIEKKYVDGRYYPDLKIWGYVVAGSGMLTYVCSLQGKLYKFHSFRLDDDKYEQLFIGV